MYFGPFLKHPHLMSMTRLRKRDTASLYSLKKLNIHSFHLFVFFRFARPAAKKGRLNVELDLWTEED